ncbi:MAG: hypothetical protein K0R52_1261 [Alphaproteobacteria bacterium]|jgi:hypothetical protein|nr:hypothetical protein [Alphaproteobacteria bacterium]
MLVWTRLLSRLPVILLSLTIIGQVSAEAAQKVRKPSVGQKNSSIVGVVEDDTIPPDEGDDDVAADEGEAASLKPKENSRESVKPGTKNKNVKPKEKSKKEQAKEKKAAEKRKKLMEGFNKAEEFHKTWYHLPFPKIKTSLEKLEKFCKAACTKSHCMDEEIAHNCHLMCPGSTVKQCADPLKKADDGSLGAEESVPGDDDMFLERMTPATGSEAPVAPPSVSASIEQADAALKEGEGEEG